MKRKIHILIILAMMSACSNQKDIARGGQKLSGHFFSEFERNELVGCQGPLLMYWVNNPGFVRAELARLGLRPGSAIEVNANVSSEGMYGQGGMYKHEITVTSVSLKSDDCSFPNVVLPGR